MSYLLDRSVSLMKPTSVTVPVSEGTVYAQGAASEHRQIAEAGDAGQESSAISVGLSRCSQDYRTKNTVSYRIKQ